MGRGPLWNISSLTSRLPSFNVASAASPQLSCVLLFGKRLPGGPKSFNDQLLQIGLPGLGPSVVRGRLSNLTVATKEDLRRTDRRARLHQPHSSVNPSHDFSGVARAFIAISTTATKAEKGNKECG